MTLVSTPRMAPVLAALWSVPPARAAAARASILPGTNVLFMPRNYMRLVGNVHILEPPPSSFHLSKWYPGVILNLSVGPTQR